LHDIDPRHRHWKWHYRNIFIFCVVHFKRSIDQSAGTDDDLPVRKTMFSLLNASNRGHYFDILDAVKGMLF
jgi:hypothetical protein